MNKIPASIAILFAVASLSAAQAVAAQVPTALLPSDTLRISVAADQVPADLPVLFEQMRAEIVAVAGSTTEIVMTLDRLRENGFDLETAQANYEAMIEDDTDLIIAFGPINARAIAGRATYPKPTILFGGVNDDLLEVPEPGATTGIDNFAYVIAAESYTNDLRTFSQLYAFERLGILLPPGPASVFEISQLSGLLSELGAIAEVIPFETAAGVADALDEVDAVYLVEAFAIPDTEIAELAELLIERRLPSFSESERSDVELGLMATNQPEGGLDTFFRRIALMVEAVANGENLADQPVFFEVNETLTLNFNTTELVGVPIRFSMVNETEFIGEYRNSLAEQVYDLETLVREALQANLGVEAQRAGVDIAGKDVASAWSDYLPALSATVNQSILDEDVAAVSNGANPQYQTGGVIGVTQVVFSPAINANVTIQRALEAAEREQLIQVEWDVILEAADAYFLTLILRANLEIQNRNLDLTRRNLRIAEQSYEAGQAGRGDVLRLESQAAQAMQSLVEAVNAFDQSLYAINAIVNAPIDREIDVLEVSIEDGAFRDANFEMVRTILDDPSQRIGFEDWLVELAIQNAPELGILDRNGEALDRSIRLDGLERFLPTVSAGLDLTRTIDQAGAGVPQPGVLVDQFYSLGIRASIPIFDSNQRRIRRQRTELQRAQLDIQRIEVVLGLEQSVRSVVLDLTSEIAAIRLTRISEEAALEALELSQASYASGAITVVQLLDAQTNYLNAQLARASATYDFLATSIVLQRLTGYFFLLRSPEENAQYMQRFQTYLETRDAGGTP